MEQRMTLVTLGVMDLSRSVAFYERIGWKRSVRKAEGVAFFQAGGVVLSLYPRTALAADAGLSPDGAGFASFSLAYNARTRDEVDAVLAEAVSAGGTLVRQAYDIFWGGYVGFFADPDGFLWEVAWNPTFPLTKEGALMLPE